MGSDGAGSDGPIDYAACDLEELPSINHQGGEATTFSSVYRTILVPSCAGPCHHAGTTEKTTFSMDDALQTYNLLLGIHGDGPSENESLPYVTENDPKRSFLYLKITGDAAAGTRMPPGASLPPDAVQSIGKVAG